MFGGKPVLSVGIMSADWMDVGSASRALAASGVRMLHFDVMDGRFAPQLTAGACFVKGVKTSLLKDVHLMIDDPLDSVHEYVAAGADLVTIHVESCRHAHRVLQRVRELPNMNDPARPVVRGVALIAMLEPLLDEVDLVLLLAVNPGFSGQSYISRTADRFAHVREMVGTMTHPPVVGIDGGVNRKTITSIAALGPDLVVSGSAVFEGGVQAIAENVRHFQGVLEAHARPLVTH